MVLGKTLPYLVLTLSYKCSNFELSEKLGHGATR